jgi:hypothetical protein
MTIAVADPSDEAGRYRALGGAGASGGGGGGEQRVAFGAFTVRLVTPARYAAEYGTLACDAGGRDAFMGALELRTRALPAVRDCVAAAGLADGACQSATRISLPASAAFNAVIEFVA